MSGGALRGGGDEKKCVLTPARPSAGRSRRRPRPRPGRRRNRRPRRPEGKRTVISHVMCIHFSSVVRRPTCLCSPARSRLQCRDQHYPPQGVLGGWSDLFEVHRRRPTLCSINKPKPSQPRVACAASFQPVARVRALPEPSCQSCLPAAAAASSPLPGGGNDHGAADVHPGGHVRDPQRPPRLV